MNSASGERAGTLPVGSALQSGKYKIAALLGTGGFGVTYQAVDSRLGRPLAIKELYPSGCGRQNLTVTLGGQYTEDVWRKTIGAFLREARLLAGLDHPGIVTVHDYFEENSTAYTVMKFIDGTDLARLVAQRGRLPEADVQRYIADVGEALSVLHAHGVLHRDLKPSNIMLTRTDRPVLVDFGAAREFIIDQTSGYTSVGTMGFAAPEQFYTQLPQGPATDIYGLAGTTYYLLTGRTPNQARPAEDSSLRPELRAALAHGLALAPGDRPLDVAAFLVELSGRVSPPAPSRAVSEPAALPAAADARNAPAATPDADDFDQTSILSVAPKPPGPSALEQRLQSLLRDLYHASADYQTWERSAASAQRSAALQQIEQQWAALDQEYRALYQHLYPQAPVTSPPAPQRPPAPTRPAPTPRIQTFPARRGATRVKTYKDAREYQQDVARMLQDGWYILQQSNAALVTVTWARNATEAQKGCPQCGQRMPLPAPQCARCGFTFPR